MRKCRGDLQTTLRFGVYPFTPLDLGLSTSHLLERRFYLALVLTRIGMTLISFWGCRSSHGVMPWSIRLLELKNTSPAWPNEKVSYHHPSTRSYPEAENSSRSTNHFVCRLTGEFWGPLRGFTYAISVSAQH